MSKDVDRVFGHPMKGMYEKLNSLGKMWRTHAFNINLTPHMFHQLMEKWLNDPQNKVPKSGKQRSSYRGNMVKQLTKADLTMANFLTGIRFTQPKSAKIILEVVDQRGKLHRMVQPIVLSAEEIEELRLNGNPDPLSGFSDSREEESKKLNDEWDENSNDDDD